MYLPVTARLLIALFASTAADLAVLVPTTLLLAMAGLALVGALIGALKEITRGPLVLGPIFAFAIALSDMTLFGLGPFFWSLVLGASISLLLEREGWKRLGLEAAAGRGGRGGRTSESRCSGLRVDGRVTVRDEEFSTSRSRLDVRISLLNVEATGQYANSLAALLRQLVGP